MKTFPGSPHPLNQLVKPLFQGTKDLPPLPVYGITQDSRKVKPGYLFVAVQGYRRDGHDFIGEALSRGAVAIVSHQKGSTGDRPYLQVPDSRKALAQLAGEFYGHPAREMSLIGITGTNGKTTTAFMVQAILKAAGYRTGLVGTVLIHDGKNSYPAQLTTPDALHLQELLRRMRQNRVQMVVMEVSSQGLKQERVFGIPFHTGIFTNLTTEHLGFHGDFASYRRAKGRFLQLLEPGKNLLYNRDDPQVARLVGETSARKYSFCIRGQGDFTGEITDHSSAGLGCRFFFPQGEKLHLSLKLLGRHNIYNALSAAGAAYLEEVPLSTLEGALSSFHPVSRRLELSTLNGILLLDDTALNPASYQRVFETVQDLSYRELLLVNSIRGRRGPEINQANARVLYNWCQHLVPKTIIITSSTDFTQEGDRVQPEEEEAFLQGLSTLPYLFFPRLISALAAALERARKGDLLLLLGAQGMDPAFFLLKKKILLQKKEIMKLTRS